MGEIDRESEVERKRGREKRRYEGNNYYNCCTTDNVQLASGCNKYRNKS